MLRAGERGPRAGVAGFALLFLFGVVALQAHGMWRERNAAIAASGNLAENLTRLLEEHARQSLVRVDSQLAAARDDLAQLGDLAQAPAGQIRAVLARALPADGLIRAFVAIDRTGDFIVSTTFATVPRINVSDRDYFLAHRERADAGMVIGAPVKTRLDGQRMLPASYRRQNAAGGFEGVLLAVINPDHFQKFYDSISIGRAGGVALFTRTGWIAARSPYAEAVVDRPWLETPMFKEHLPRSPVGTVRQVVVADGVERIYSYRALREFPAVVYLGLSLDDILAGWREEVWRQAFILALIAAATALASISLLAQMRRREAASGALARSEARFRSLTDLSADWFWEQDAELRFTYFSPGYEAAARIRGVPTALGKRRWEQGNLGLSEAHWAEHRADLAARKPFRDLELSRADVDGARLYFLISGEPMVEDGRFLGYRGVGRDVTENHRAREEILQLNATLESRVRERTADLDLAIQELESFCYTLAHDMRAPLRSVGSFARMVLEDQREILPEGARADLERVFGSAQRMGEQLDELLAFARLGRKPISVAQVGMNDLARAALAEVRAGHPERWVEERVADLPPCRADPDLLKMVFLHLLSNAYKFTQSRESAFIEVGCAGAGEADGYLTYFVRDNGIGFDMRFASRLFGVFQRLHTQPEYHGSGAGLAIVKRIVALHGGRVWAEAAVDAGASFYFTLPAASTNPPAA